MSQDTYGGRKRERGAIADPTQNADPFGGRKPLSVKGANASLANMVRGQSNLSRRMETAGREQYQLGGAAYKKGLNYFDALMGDRGSQYRALSPAILNINEAGLGEDEAIRNQFQRGGARDLTLANARRARAAQKNALFARAPGEAAAALSEMGGQGVDRSAQFGAQASQAYNSAGNLSAEAVRQGMEQQKRRGAFWKNLGGLAARGAAAFFTGGASEGIFGIAKALGNKWRSRGGGGPLNTGGFNTVRSGYGPTQIPPGRGQ